MVRYDPAIATDDLRLDRVAQPATHEGKALTLPPLDFKSLACLLTHRGAVITRTMLLKKVWGYSFDPKTSLVKADINRLRTKAERRFAREVIQTVRGVGHILVAA